MDSIIGAHQITDVATLERLYGAPAGAAVEKELNYIHPHYRAMIAASPFVVLATGGPQGLNGAAYDSGLYERLKAVLY